MLRRVGVLADEDDVHVADVIQFSRTAFTHRDHGQSRWRLGFANIGHRDLQRCIQCRVERWCGLRLLLYCFGRHAKGRGAANGRRTAHHHVTNGSGYLLRVVAPHLFDAMRQDALIDQAQHTGVLRIAQPAHGLYARGHTVQRGLFQISVFR